jgi:hypothetical protein
MSEAMRIVATPDAVEFVRARGGQVFVWILPMAYGYHPIFVLEASTDSPGAEHRFHRFEGEDIEVFMDSGDHDLPDSVHLAVKGVLRKQVRAYWNGHSFASG